MAACDSLRWAARSHTSELLQPKGRRGGSAMPTGEHLLHAGVSSNILRPQPKLVRDTLGATGQQARHGGLVAGQSGDVEWCVSVKDLRCNGRGTRMIPTSPGPGPGPSPSPSVGTLLTLRTHFQQSGDTKQPSELVRQLCGVRRFALFESHIL